MSPSSNRHRRAALLVDQDGFLLIEALVAAFVLVLAVVAIYTAYDASTRATFRAQQSQVELSRAQQEMERIRATGYDRIGLTTAPVPSADPASPLYRVRGDGRFDLNSSGSPNYATLVVNDGSPSGSDGRINPGPEDFQSGDVSGKIYRFVVWQKDNGCPLPTCTGRDIKRVIIVVQPETTAAGGTRGYVEIHSDFIDPDAHALSNVTPAGGLPPAPRQFWLSDTPCDPNGDTVRQPINGDHDLHNTLGTACDNVPKQGAVAGPPDALLSAVPPGLPTDPYFDYQSDWIGDPQKKGIQLAPEVQTNPPCFWDATPDPQTDPQVRFHTWLSDEFPPGPPFDISGPVNLSFFSKTMNPAPQPGTLCAWIFKRSPSGNDTLIGGGAQTPPLTYSQDPWPTEYATPGVPPMPLSTSATLTGPPGRLQVPPHWRLGLTISVASDVPRALELMYDHPAFPSRLQVDTTTPPPP